MDFHYEIENPKLKKMVEDKAKELGMTVDEVVWGYINRGLMEDNFSEESCKRLHSEEFLKMVDEALGLD
ncbi:hypothetical protein [uncultured Methanobrevibacter sp.]|uniref:hypothetical protein n=1 Tax=uncultured Methanobrevibacter sp. TaxID=253161 RepID=UPI00260B4ACF|nr:hypothetical protein [uncultured Methanobrevibacter sp.]